MRIRLLAVLCAAMFAAAVPAGAQATPTVQSKDALVPVPGFPKTGNSPGAGAAVDQEITISGTEYGGFPPPVEQVDVYLPQGLTVDANGFPTCPVSTLEPSGQGPRACPKGSIAGPVGTVQGFVSFGNTVVPESATFEPFYAAGGGLTFFISGHEPVVLEELSRASFSSGGAGFGEVLAAEMPLIETVPGAQDASLESLKFKLGSAIKAGKGTDYYFRAPEECPGGYLPFKTMVVFAGLGGLSRQTVTSEYHAPCSADSYHLPIVKKVQFKGDTAEPEIVISGKNLGAAPPSPSYPPGGCPASGSGRLYDESLWFEDTSQEWAAGRGGPGGFGDCIGLDVVSWSEKKVTLRFGNDYDSPGTGWELHSGDAYELGVLGTGDTGMVVFKGKI